MSDERNNGRATASTDGDPGHASERSGPVLKHGSRSLPPPRPPVEAVYDDLDDEPESAGSITAGASQALTLGGPDSHVPASDVSEKASSAEPSDETTEKTAQKKTEPTGDEAGDEGPSRETLRPELRSASATKRPAAAPDDDAHDLDLEREALPAHSSGRQSLPPALRGAVTPAPPMSVPSLRPPVAPPPPLRASTPPPMPTGGSRRPPSPFAAPVHGLGGTPTAPATTEPSAPVSVRSSLPEAAPAPERRHLGTHQTRPPEPFVAISANALDQSPADATAKTLHGPVHQLRPSIKTEPLETIPLPLERQLPRRSPKKAALWTLAGLLVALVAVGLLASRADPPGTLVVSVFAPGGVAIPKLSVFVDEQLVCSYSPCRVNELEAGAHEVRADAPGFLPSQPQQLEMRPGTDTIHNLILTPKEKYSALRVDAEGEGLTVFVDGKSLGAPPITLDKLAPGEHVVRVEGQHFVSEHHALTLEPEEKRHLGPIKPKVKTGSLTINAGTGAEGANVTLDGKPIATLPTTLALDGQRAHRLVAEKEGFDRFEHEVVFPDGKAQLSVDVALLEAYEETSEEETEAAGAESGGKPASKATFATLSMNSIPPSVVLLDGQPLGKTPRIGVRTKPGVHSVTFVHPQRGRKVKRVHIRAGQSKTVSIRF